MTWALLRADVARLRAWADAAGEACPVADVELTRDVGLRFSLRYDLDNSVRTCRLVVKFDVGGYPRAGVAVWAEGEAEEGVVDAIQLTNMSLSEDASVNNVLDTLAASIGVDLDAEEIQATEVPDQDMSCEEEEEMGGEEMQLEEANEFAMNQGQEMDDHLMLLERAWHRRCAQEDAQGEGEEGAEDPSTDRRKYALPPALRQIFTAAESSKILINELKQLVRDNLTGLTEFAVQPVDSDVHRWDICISDVDGGSTLGLELASTAAAEGAPQMLRMELIFTPGLHPAYPPWLQLLSPRLEGFVGEAVMASVLFTPTGWDPLKPIKAAVRHAQALLEAHGRLAFPRGGGGGPNGLGIYSRAAIVACRLEALSSLSVRPRWAYDHEDLYRACTAVSAEESQRLRSLRTDSKAEGAKDSKAADASQRAVWAAGTGYGHGKSSTVTWDVKASEAAVQHRDAEIRGLVEELTACCAVGGLDTAVVSSSCLLPFVHQLLHGCSFNDMQKRTQLFAAVLRLVDVITDRADLRPHLFETAAAAPRDTALLSCGIAAPDAAAPALPPSPGPPRKRSRKAAESSGGTAEPVCESGTIQKRPLSTAAQAAPGPSAGSRGGGGGGGASVLHVRAHGSVAEALATAAETASVFERMHANSEPLDSSLGADSGGGHGGSGGAGRSARDADDSSHTASQGAGQDLAPLRGVACSLISTNAALSAFAADDAELAWSCAAPRAGTGGGGGGAGARTEHKAPAAPLSTSPNRRGGASTRASRAAAREWPSSALAAAPAASDLQTAPDGTDADATYCAGLRAHQFDLDTDFGAAHRFADHGSAAERSAKRAKRILVEAPDMRSSLPLAFSSSIFLRVDAARMHLWKALITGPEDTPYSSGCFLFDIMLPSDYPTSAPKVVMTTTGGGSVRFNPNLYADGKVCLSLLGTWHGDSGEVWHPDTSTVLQVLMSVQALIMVPDPYFNEPGFERDRGTKAGDYKSDSYNQRIREYTLRHAMLSHLRKPPREFSEVVRTHFALKRNQVLNQVCAWVSEASGEHRATMSSLQRELQVELDKLIDTAT